MAQILCENCNRNLATEFVKINGQTYYLCPQCAEQIMFNDFFDEPYDDYNAMDSFDELINPFVSRGGHTIQKQKVCPVCGTTQSEAMDYKFGCSHCYEVFKDIALDAVKKLHGQEYNGVYAVGADKSKKMRLSQMTKADIPMLEKFKKACKDRGDYQKASVIENKIKELGGGN